MKYSDGTPIKASDFTYAIQRLFKLDSGGSAFFDDIVGAEDYAERQGGHDQRDQGRRQDRRDHDPADSSRAARSTTCSA